MSKTDLFDLTGKVAIITGASSGLGVQMAKALARQGADIAILARRVDKLKTVAKEIRELGVRCLPVSCDVTNTAHIQKAIAEIMILFRSVVLPTPFRPRIAVRLPFSTEKDRSLMTRLLP